MEVIASRVRCRTAQRTTPATVYIANSLSNAEVLPALNMRRVLA
ncbi:hypothetical protein [Nostoc sp.]